MVKDVAKVSILYLPRLWFLLLGIIFAAAMFVASQSSIYRGYDFYLEDNPNPPAGFNSLNPLSTEVMISTILCACHHSIDLRVSILYLPRLWFLHNTAPNSPAALEKSQSSIYRGYDFYIPNPKPKAPENSRVSILYLPRLWFLLLVRGVIAQGNAGSQSSIYRGYDFYWLLFLHPLFCESRVNCANQTWVR